MDSKEVSGRQTRRRGIKRPRLRWMDGWSQIGLEEYGCEKWRNRAFDRTEWTSLMREAKVNLRAVE
jgi:hypothetical protein